MAKEFVVHCDESIEKGRFYSNFFGGALVRSEHIEIVREKLRQKKIELNLLGEIKWDKITFNYKQKYIDIIDYFLDFVAEDVIKIRVMFTQNSNVPEGLTADHAENKFFILYYEFLKHAFGFPHCNDGNEPVRLRLLLDQLPDNRERAEKFRAYLCALSRNRQFREAGLILNKEDISDIRSHEHDILQCLDIIMGSIQFRLNNLHKVIAEGAKKRGKRTRAKEAVYKHINKRIREIYPNFNIGISTGTNGGITNRWHHSYRHWCFIPAKKMFDASRTKRK